MCFVQHQNLLPGSVIAPGIINIAWCLALGLEERRGLN
ncbi:hypothetical protein CSC17_2904 [Klebsiella oxytoca]|nr:hypothetical protein CSC17_2904 [Klebsiella oxytoca]